MSAAMYFVICLEYTGESCVTPARQYRLRRAVRRLPVGYSSEDSHAQDQC